MCKDSNCQTTKIKDACLVPVTLALKEALRVVFEKKYKPGPRITWGPFEQDWTREIDTLVPTPPTVRAILYKANRRASQYQIVNGFCQLLLNHQCYEECIEIYQGLEPPEEPDLPNPDPEHDQNTELLEPPPDKKTMRENISRLWSMSLIGRKDERGQILEWLAKSESGQIAITGLGGIGKTTLAVAVAFDCLAIVQAEDTYETGADENVESTETTKTFGTSEVGDDVESLVSLPIVLPRFDAIIFVSARRQFLEDANINESIQRDRTLDHLISTIAKTLDCRNSLTGTQEDDLRFICETLEHHSTLLILDDLESFDEPRKILSLVSDRINGFPNTVKIIVTGRGHMALQKQLKLSPLSDEDASALIQQRAKAKKLEISDADCLALAKQGCNIPGVILYAVGQIAAGATVPYVLQSLRSAEGELASHLFEEAIAPLRHQPTHHLLMALALFPTPALPEAMAAVAFGQPNPIATEKGLTTLLKLSLIERCVNPPTDSASSQAPEASGTRFTMLPLTQEFVLAELNAHPDFAAKARDRWIQWYCHWTTAITHETDWRRWNQPDALVQDWGNVQSVIEWCVAGDRYEAFWALWSKVRGYTHFAGYWTERLNWLEWFIDIARQRQDWPQLAEALYDKGRTLLLRGVLLDQVETLFQEAWNLCEQHHPTFQGEVGIDLAVLAIKQEQWQSALQWLQLIEDRLTKHKELSSSEQSLQASSSSDARLEVQVAYYRGEISLKNKDYDRTKAYYQLAIDLAEEISWQRASVYSQAWLVDVAIEEQDYGKAESLLEKVLPILEEHQDQRCLTLCRKAYALLEKARGNHSLCRTWATQALDGFQRLGMVQEIENVKELLTSSKLRSD